jgi:hypothetical protein
MISFIAMNNQAYDAAIKYAEISLNKQQDNIFA